MPLSRRHFIGITASAVAFACKSANAQDERALFWRVETPDGGRGVVFAYARVAAAAAPDVTKDGIRFMENAKRVVLDMNNTRFPAMKIDPALPPLLPKLDPARAQQIRSILASMHLPPAQFETLPGSSSPPCSTPRVRPTRRRRSEASSSTGRRHSAGR